MFKQNDIPNYTLEEKAAVFDMLWNTCGNGRAILERYTHKDNLHKGSSEIVPVYSFSIHYTGQVDNFKDVLHNLVTNSRKDLNVT
jgi:hypothetical protein